MPNEIARYAETFIFYYATVACRVAIESHNKTGTAAINTKHGLFLRLPFEMICSRVFITPLVQFIRKIMTLAQKIDRWRYVSVLLACMLVTSTWLTSCAIPKTVVD